MIIILIIIITDFLVWTYFCYIFHFRYFYISIILDWVALSLVA